MFISGDNLNLICDVSIYDRNYFNKYIKHNNIKHVIFIGENCDDLINYLINKTIIFFTKIEYIDYFNSLILPKLQKKFILVTHNGDLLSGQHNNLINNPLLIKWYGQNMNKICNKTEGIPIGLENKIWKRTCFDIIKKKSSNQKKKLLYLNFSLNTNPKRKKIMTDLLNKGFKKKKNLQWHEYISELSNYKFAISPEGNGIDCHRTWECLYLGVIPIVKKSIPMSFFCELPILVIDDFNIITHNYLNEIYDKNFNKKKFNLEKLNIDYWKKIFQNNINC